MPDNLKPNDFWHANPNRGREQTTFKGWPLYYYASDKAPGDFNGDGGAWHIVDPDNQPRQFEPYEPRVDLTLAF